MTTIESIDADEELTSQLRAPESRRLAGMIRACARRRGQGLARRCTDLLHSKSEWICESSYIAAMSSGGFRYVSELSTSSCHARCREGANACRPRWDESCGRLVTRPVTDDSTVNNPECLYADD